MFLPVLIIVSVICVSIGVFLFFKPGTTIDLQKRFYEKINWRIEPISMEKEIRNTKIMGLFLVGVTLLIVLCVLWR